MQSVRKIHEKSGAKQTSRVCAGEINPWTAISTGLLYSICVTIMAGQGACSPTGKSTQKSIASIEGCEVAPDQYGTFTGEWLRVPVLLSAGGSAFDTTEKGAIQSASQSWNDFYSAQLHFQMLDVDTQTSTGAESEVIAKKDLCLNAAVTKDGFLNKIEIQKVSDGWDESLSGIIALTNLCYKTGPDDSSPLKIIFNGSMQINYTHFFGANQSKPDLESIFLHELGHLIGLNHSCEFDSTSSGMPNCGNKGVLAEYKSAVMYPTVEFNNDDEGEIRRALASNDKRRAKCLYAKFAHSTPTSEDSDSDSQHDDFSDL